MELCDLPDNPIPAGTVLAPLVTDDGVTLRAARFPATVRQPRGTICLFQGRGEQIEKYFRVVESLRRRGFAVAAFDWRGQGGSARLIGDGRSGHVRAFSDYARDIDAFAKQMVLPDCPPPYFAIGHSLGGLLLMSSVDRVTPWLSRLVLSAPFFDFGQVPFSRRTIARLTRIACLLGLGHLPVPDRTTKVLEVRSFETNPLTSDPAVHRMLMDLTTVRPDLGVDVPTIRWVRSAAKAMDRIDRDRYAEAINLPVMLVNCGADAIVSVPAIERMARRLRTVAYVFVPGARHEIMMERDVYAAQFWAAFDAFVPGTAPG